jgi:hypothetical protein
MPSGVRAYKNSISVEDRRFTTEATGANTNNPTFRDHSEKHNWWKQRLTVWHVTRTAFYNLLLPNHDFWRHYHMPTIIQYVTSLLRDVILIPMHCHVPTHHPTAPKQSHSNNRHQPPCCLQADCSLFPQYHGLELTTLRSERRNLPTRPDGQTERKKKRGVGNRHVP